ncbi:MAG: hypothetical protein JEZ11_19740 [Desulfobacterales bacterium]|nr:hypothetical protein [Desulfobacterales bacterium]
MEMKMVMVVCDAAHEEAVLGLLEEAGVSGYTHWPRVLGRGQRSEPKMDTAVWPGFNAAVATAVDESTAGPLMEALATLNETLGGKGLKAFCWVLDRVI